MIVATKGVIILSILFVIFCGCNGDNGLLYFKTDPDGGNLRMRQPVTLSWALSAHGCTSQVFVVSWCSVLGGICQQVIATTQYSTGWQASLDAIPGGYFRLGFYDQFDKCATVKYAYSKNFTTTYCSTFSMLGRFPQPVWIRQLGDPAEFSTNVTGTDLRYQWFLNGNVVPGATEWTYRIAAVTKQDLGYYKAKVVDKCGTTQNTTQALLATCPPLAFKDFNPIVLATVGQPLTVSVSVTSSGQYSVSWYKGNSTKIISNTLYLYFSIFSAQDYGQYTVKLDDACISPVTRTLLISDKPFVISENPPSRVNMFVGDTFNLYVGVSKGDITVSYQWFKNDKPIPGATTANYTIPPFSMLDSGTTYIVTVSYGEYVSNSTPSVVYPYSAPTISSATASAGPIFLNESLTYTVSAVGARLKYEWLINGHLQPSLTGQETIKIVATSFSLNGSEIIANVSNPNGYALSEPFVLVIKPKPWFTVTSWPDLYLLRNEKTVINMTGLVLGEELQFAWLQNGAVIDGSNSVALEIQIADSLSPATYQMQASNPSGITLSPSVHVYPEPAPKIIGHSSSTFYFFPNDRPTLYINVTGRGVQYKWFNDAQPISDTNMPEVTLWPIAHDDNGTVITAEAYNANYGSTFNFTYVLKPAPIIVKQVPDDPQIYYFAGQSLAFRVEAIGEQLDFDWNIPDGLSSHVTSTATTSVLTVNNITQDFFVIPQVTNPTGVVLGKNISVELSAAPFIDQFPEQTMVIDQKPFTFEALVRGEVMSYMWYIDHKLQPNSNSSQFILPISTKYNNSIVKVEASNAAGTATTFTQLFVITAPRLTRPLEAIYEALSDSSWNIDVEATGYNLVYEWRKQGSFLMNTTIGQFSIAKTSTEDSGMYQLLLHNEAGTAGPYQFQLSIAALTINTPQVSNIEVFAGDNVTLSVTLNTQLNASDFVITWLFNKTMIISATGTTLDITNVTAENNGQYSIVIRYASSQVSSFVANVIILGVPVLQQPLQAPDAKSGRNASITALVSPELRLSYQWYKNGQMIEGEVGKTIQFEALLSMQGDRYSVLLSNPAGQTKSNEVAIKVQLSDTQTGLIVGAVVFVVIVIVTVVTIFVRRKINQRRNVSFSKATYGVEDIRYPLLRPWTPPENSKLCNVDKLPFVISKTTLDFGGAADSLTVDEEYVDNITLEWRGGIGSTLASFKLKPNTNANESVPLINVGSDNPCVVVFHPPISPKCELVVEPRHLLLESKRKSKKSKSINVEDGDNDQIVQVRLKMNVTTSVSALIGVELPQLNKYFYLLCNLVSSPSVWIDVDEIDKESAPIGEGGFGVVYRGKYRDEDVAVKMLRCQEFVDAKTLEEFDREIHLLSTLKYEGIVPFVGASNLPGKLAIVTRFMPNGSLEKWMQKKIPYGTKVRIALEIAKAIQFLHKNNVLHRDIKPENVLIESTDVNSPLLIRLSDFGSARQIYEDKIESYTKNVGTPIYMAPEILKKKRYDKAADIYSFGVLLWVLITQKEPYSAFNHIWDVTKFVLDGNREVIPAGCPSDYADLITGCWQQEPSQRLAIQVVIDRLEAMYENEFKLK